MSVGSHCARRSPERVGRMRLVIVVRTLLCGLLPAVAQKSGPEDARAVACATAAFTDYNEKNVYNRPRRFP
jgi:hypothetical protein